MGRTFDSSHKIVCSSTTSVRSASGDSGSWSLSWDAASCDLNWLVIPVSFDSVGSLKVKYDVSVVKKKDQNSKITET